MVSKSRSKRRNNDFRKKTPHGLLYLHVACYMIHVAVIGVVDLARLYQRLIYSEVRFLA